jgi:Family of unknown function (DUF5906)
LRFLRKTPARLVGLLATSGPILGISSGMRGRIRPLSALRLQEGAIHWQRPVAALRHQPCLAGAVSTDTITVLFSTSGKFATKQYSRAKDGGIKNRSYGNETYFAVETGAIRDITHLAGVLERLADEPFRFVIRGEPLPGINEKRSRRLLHPDKKTGDPATFRERARHWFMVDIDHIPCPAAIDPISDPDGAIEYVIGLLTPELHDATCSWQLSSSQGVFPGDETISAHLWFWSAVPLDDAELTRWAVAENQIAGHKLIDPAVYRAVQAHYTAKPIFKSDLRDPLPKRYGMRQGLDDAVGLIIPAPNRKNPEEPSHSGYEPGLGVDAYLAEIGGAKGFRCPIVSAVASWISIHGSKANVEPLKALIRAAIARADPGNRPASEIERYASDQHLDEIVEWVLRRHGDQPPKGARTTPGSGSPDEGVRLEDFYAFMPMHNYIFAPTREMWPGSSVNARISPIPIADGEILATSWLDRHRPVEQLTWAPGLPLFIKNRLIAEGGWIERNNVNCFNLYRPPIIKPGDPKKAGRWIDHIDKVYPEDAEHIRLWFAHRVQRPQDKLNHALVLGGLQGIGKDTLIEPVKRGVGPWNVAEPSPQQLMGQYNGFAKSVILRISEAHDLGDVDRYQFYEHLKVYIAAPPDVLRVNEKYLREHNVLNCCAVIITTNHKTDGVFLPADDRRHYVAWSFLVKEDFDETYWTDLWAWYDSGGDRHVAAYLAQLDISAFNPKAPPKKTAAFWDIVNASRAPEDAELADALDLLGNPIPDAVTVTNVINRSTTEFADWLKDRKNRRNIPHRFEACGYIPVRNPDATDGLWKVGSRRVVVYGKATLTFHEQLDAVKRVAAGGAGQ